MLDYEDLLTRLQAEGLTLDTANQSSDPEVIHSLKGKKNQTHITNAAALTEYLKPYPIVMVDDPGTLSFANSTLLGIDIETGKVIDHPQAGLNPKVSRVRLIQIFDGSTVYIIDCNQHPLLDWLHQLTDTPMVAHNATFEAQHFHHAGITLNNLDCSMLMGRVFLNRNVSLKDAAADAFDLTLDKVLQVSDWNREALLPEQIQYAAADAVIAYQLHQRFSEWFEQNPHYRDTYQFLRSLIYPLVRQMANGVCIDVDAHTQIVDEWSGRVEELQGVLAADGLTNPTSTKQVQAYLRERLSPQERANWPLTGSGNLSTKAEVIARLESHPTLGLLAEYNTTRTRLANFGPKLQSLMIEGRIYPSYQIAGMVTGRFSSTQPNQQNLPRNGFKHVYVAPPGHQFVTGDLSQVELRVAGLISGDPVINESYANGIDLHTLMAAKMTGKPESEVSKPERTAAKAVNFGLLFGGGAKGLQQQAKSSYGVSMSLEEATAAKEAFHQTYRQFTWWQQAIVKHTNQHDESESTYSRLTRHYGPADHWEDGKYRDVYTHAINYPIQSSAWEILALAIKYVDGFAPPGVHISHHVYDELTLVAPDHLVEDTKVLLLAAFEYGYLTVFPGCDVTGIIEVGSGRNWAEAG